MLLGWIDAKSAAPMNFFVGGLQILTPLYLIFTANGDADVILSASGLFLFSFTYLYVAVNLTWNLDSTGLGYFCLFVAITAVVFSYLNFTRFADPAFGVIWIYWAFLWLLFFLLLGRKRDGIGRYTGAVCAIQGWVTGWIPAFLLLTGSYDRIGVPLAIGLAIFGVVVFAALIPWARREQQRPPATPAPTGDHAVA